MRYSIIGISIRIQQHIAISLQHEIHINILPCTPVDIAHIYGKVLPINDFFCGCHRFQLRKVGFFFHFVQCCINFIVIVVKILAQDTVGRVPFDQLIMLCLFQFQKTLLAKSFLQGVKKRPTP